MSLQSLYGALWGPYEKELGLWKRVKSFFLPSLDLEAYLLKFLAGEFLERGAQAVEELWANRHALWILEKPKRSLAQEELSMFFCFRGDQALDALDDKRGVLVSKAFQAQFLEGPGAGSVLSDESGPKPTFRFFIAEDCEGSEFGFRIFEELDLLGVWTNVVLADVVDAVDQPKRKTEDQGGAREAARGDKGRRDQHGKNISPEFILPGHQNEAEGQKRKKPQQDSEGAQAGHPLFEREQKKDGGGECREEPFAKDTVRQILKIGPVELGQVIEDPICPGDAAENGAKALEGDLAEASLLDGGDDPKKNDGFFYEDSHEESEGEEEEPTLEGPALRSFAFEGKPEEGAKGEEEDSGAVDEGGEGVG